MSLQEINAAAEIIYEAVDPNANIIFGALVDETMGGDITVTVIATGFLSPDQTPTTPSKSAQTDTGKRNMEVFY